MNALSHHTRRLTHALASDLERAAERLDADAVQIRAAVGRATKTLASDFGRTVQRLDADAVQLRAAAGRATKTLASDLERTAERLDADAVQLRAALDRTGIPRHVAAFLASLPARLDRAGALFAAWAIVALRRLDALALRLDGVRPGLVGPRQAARLARTMTAVTALLALFATGAFATMLGASRGASNEHLAVEQAPARQVALAEPAAVPNTEGAHATGPVAATGATGPAVANAAPAATRTIPAQRGALPIGKGMWIWQPERAEGGDPAAIVRRAKAANLTHLYVRTGTLKGGFDGGEFLNRLLPPAHAAGIRVYGWDFPYLNNIDSDVARAAAAAKHLTPDGHRIDGFASDIELRSMGVNINNHTAFEYGQKLRAMVGREFPLIATVPRPNPALKLFPFPEVLAHFDAVAPMVYWMGNDPAATVIDTIRQLAPLGRPIIPVGQAYDGGSEGGPAGIPPRHQIQAFMKAAEEAGAVSVSWWSWQHADQQAWDAVRDAGEFMPPAGAGSAMKAGQVRAYQALLWSLGFAGPAGINGLWDPATVKAVSDYQRAARLPVTGVIDAATREALLTPFPPPINPTP